MLRRLKVNMNLVLACALMLVSSSNGDTWRWPGPSNPRIDNKLGFVGQDHVFLKGKQQEELPFQEPLDTDGFYNRPPNSGRFPVRVEGPQNPSPKNERHTTKTAAVAQMGNAQQYCKCLNTPECGPNAKSEASCGVGKHLCCYKRPNTIIQRNTEYFDEVEDERPMLLPGRENLARPFPPPPGAEFNGFVGSYNPIKGQESIDAMNKRQEAGLQQKPDILVGPGGPTNIVGPAPVNDNALRSESAQRGVLVGPGGPTGIIGPGYGQQSILVGPGGPTGIIGPGRGNRRPNILVGPGGPTGIIGPGYRRQHYGVLSGPGGPTGVIGPRRPILVGPNGPTGQIGPQTFFG